MTLTLSDGREIDDDARYAVDGYDGVAFYVAGPETMPDEDTEWSGYEVPTGRVLMVMVGDDRLHAVDPDELTKLDEDAYCSGCGQIGCGAYALLWET